MRQVFRTLECWAAFVAFLLGLVYVLYLVYYPGLTAVGMPDHFFGPLMVLFGACALVSLRQAGTNTVRSIELLACLFNSAFRKRLIADLNSDRDRVRRHALQVLVDFYGAPVGEITCWPRTTCTDLQLTAMEAMFGRWLEVKERLKSPTQKQVIDALFSFAPDDAPPISPPETMNPELGERLERLADLVKDSVLDWNAETFTTEDAPADEDATLGPLPRAPFVAAMREKITEAVEHVADLLAEVPNVRSLAACEASVGEILADLRGEAVALALEMRGEQEPDPRPLARLDPPHAQIPRWLKPDTTWPPPPDFPGGWVKKYRRIRRAGL
jgi:hypothetical protein